MRTAVPCRARLHASQVLNVLTNGCVHSSRNGDDAAISPGTMAPPGPVPDANYFDRLAPAPPPKDRSTTNADNRRNFGHNNHTGPVPTISRDPPSAPLAQIAPWELEPSTIPATAYPPTRNFFDDATDPMSMQVSPAYRPSIARPEISELAGSPVQRRASHRDDRRPSVASSSTIGSQDSGFAGMGRTPHKKLGSFFHDDGSNQSPKQGSQSSISGRPPHHRSRNNSFQNADRGVSPNSRPRSPLPSSDVVPWLFQDHKVRSTSPSSFDLCGTFGIERVARSPSSRTGL